MSATFVLPDDVLRLVFEYDGTVLKAFIVALIRRLSVRTYQGVLSRHFHFYGLQRYCVPHLIRLVQTEILCIQRFGGEANTRVFRKSIHQWFPWIHQLKMRRVLLNTVKDLLFCHAPGHPLFRVQSIYTANWLHTQRDLILGFDGNNNVSSIQKYLKFTSVE